MSKPVLTLEASRPRFATIDIARAAESLAGMIADWYGNAPLPNARISADIIAIRLARFEMQPPAGETIRTTQDGSMEAAPETGQSPVGAASTEQGDRAPTKADVYAAALRWCGEKDRETFPEDIAYFQHNWSALPGLRRYVEAEAALASRLRAVSQP